MIGFKKKRGVGGGAGPSISKHTARIVNGGVSKKKIHITHGRLQKTTQRLSSKLAHGSKQRGGWGGGAQPPPFANRMLAWLVL